MLMPRGQTLAALRRLAVLVLVLNIAVSYAKAMGAEGTVRGEPQMDFSQQPDPKYDDAAVSEKEIEAHPEEKEIRDTMLLPGSEDEQGEFMRSTQRPFDMDICTFASTAESTSYMRGIKINYEFSIIGEPMQWWSTNPITGNAEVSSKSPEKNIYLGASGRMQQILF